MKRERLLHVPGTGVIWADRHYFRGKYKQVQKGSALSDSEIDAMIVDEMSYLSQPSTVENEVLRPFAWQAREAEILRPPGYNRAGIFETSFGLVDVKGIGVPPPAQPKPGPYSTGTLEFPIAIHELCVQRYIDLYRPEYGLRTAKCLAILLLPVMERNVDGDTPCVLLVREAFSRPDLSPTSCKFLDQISEVSLDVEMKLRRIGLTTTVPDTALRVELHGGEISVISPDGLASDAVHAYFRSHVATGGVGVPGRFDVVNVQFGIDPASGELCLVDFGSYWHGARFDAPAIAAFQGGGGLYLRLRGLDEPGYTRKARVRSGVPRMFKRVTERIPPGRGGSGRREITGRRIAVDAAKLLAERRDLPSIQSFAASRLGRIGWPGT